MKRKLPITIIIIFASFTVGCSILFPAQTSLKITVIDIKNPQMELGELVEITWTYWQPSDLIRQKYVLVQHTILGETRSEFELDNEDRELNFIFQAPTTVFIMGYDSSTESVPATQVAIDIRFSTNYFLRASVKADPLPPDSAQSELARGYPRLGYPKNKQERTIEFTNFLGVRDIAETGVLDFFKGNIPGQDSQSPFRMISLSRKESEGFDTREGSAFPIFCHEGRVPNECHTSVNLPDAYHSGVIDKANALVFGGALAYGGSPKTVKTSSGDEVTVHYDPDTTGEPIFIVIALRSPLDNYFANPSGNLEIVDIYLGNVTQKLVVNAYAGTNQNDVSLGNWSADYNGIPPEVSHLSGNVKGAYIKDTFTLGQDNKLQITFNITNIEWNVPFRNDDNLLGIPSARHLCEVTNTCREGE
jgi:hypothetical protein